MGIPIAVSHVALLLANTSPHPSRSDTAQRQAKDCGTSKDKHSENDGTSRVVIAVVVVFVLRNPDVVIILLTHRGGLNRLGLGRL